MNSRIVVLILFGSAIFTNSLLGQAEITPRGNSFLYAGGSFVLNPSQEITAYTGIIGFNIDGVIDLDVGYGDFTNARRNGSLIGISTSIHTARELDKKPLGLSLDGSWEKVNTNFRDIDAYSFGFSVYNTMGYSSQEQRQMIVFGMGYLGGSDTVNNFYTSLGLNFNRMQRKISTNMEPTIVVGIGEETTVGFGVTIRFYFTGYEKFGE